MIVKQKTDRKSELNKWYALNPDHARYAKMPVLVPAEVIRLMARYQTQIAVFWREYQGNGESYYSRFCLKVRPALGRWQQAVQEIRQRRPHFPYDRINNEVVNNATATNRNS